MSAKVEELAEKLLFSLEHDGTLTDLMSQYHECYHPFGRIVWTGFKPNQAKQAVVGQWLFWPPTGHDKGPFYYASVPGGGAGRYELGDSFDVGPDELTPFSSKKGLKAALLDGLIRLITVVLEDEPPWIEEFLAQGERDMVRPRNP